MESCYFISTYQAGDDYSETTFMASSLEDVCSIVETNECDWQEGIYNYAIVWKINTGYLMASKTGIEGIYNAAKKEWIDFAVSNDEEGFENPVLSFENIRLELNEKTGPHLTFSFEKKRKL